MMGLYHLETIGLSATTGSLELSASGAHVGLDAVVGVGVVDRGGVTEVSDGLAGILGAAQEHGVGALGLAEGELVEGDALTTGLGDTSSGILENSVTG
jgi:hypothetical protein